MFKKKYLSLFPNTIKAKNVVAPYNRKASRRTQRAMEMESESSINKRSSSQMSVQLKNLNDFSSKNPQLHMLLLEAGETLKNSTGADGEILSFKVIKRLLIELFHFKISFTHTSK